MSFRFELTDKLRAALDKLAERDKALAVAVRKKIDQICNCNHESIEHFKNLKGNMSRLKRVHIGCFVLTFQVKADTIIFEDLQHHDKAYGR